MVASQGEVQLRSFDALVVHLPLTPLGFLLSIELEESIAEGLLGDLVVLDGGLAEFVSARGEELEQIKVIEVLGQVSDVDGGAHDLGLLGSLVLLVMGTVGLGQVECSSKLLGENLIGTHHSLHRVATYLSRVATHLSRVATHLSRERHALLLVHAILTGLTLGDRHGLLLGHSLRRLLGEILTHLKIERWVNRRC